MRILVTGCAGFIGFHMTQRLLAEGHTVVGVDNLNSTYDPALKTARLALLLPHPAFTFHRLDLADASAVKALFETAPFDRIIHLAAQAGVRYSLQNPSLYVASNVVGFLNLLEGCRRQKTPHLLFASSSSVYGLSRALPFSEHDPADHPVSIYAATKKAGELMAHTYAHLFGIPATGLRFFTVYGPWGRPDMAPFLFLNALFQDRPIEIFNYGDMARDFTYVDDVVEGMARLLNRIPAPQPEWNATRPDPATSSAPYRIYNIGNHTPVALTDFIACLERLTGKTARRTLLPMQPGDVCATCADISDLSRDTGFSPSTPLEVGLSRFVEWYRSFYHV